MSSRWIAALFVFALAPVVSRAEDLAPGKFLVASRDLGDPNFAETVILLVSYDEQKGAMGLVVNHRTDVPLSRVFQDLKAAKGRADLAYVGGPVELSSVLALLKSSSPPDEAKRVFGDVYLLASKALLEKTLASEVGPDAFHVYVGYAGWGPGQLEHEIDLGGWHILQADAANVFHADPDSVWKRMIQRTETQIARADR
jgi:putative transcriptional regulator